MAPTPQIQLTTTEEWMSEFSKILLHLEGSLTGAEHLLIFGLSED